MSRVLFKPITLRGLEIRNRIWVPPMCQYAVDTLDGIPSRWHVLHLASFARGGAGAILVEATGIVPEARISLNDLGLWNDEQTEAFKPITAFVRSLGAKIGIQLSHAGRKASVYPEWGTDGEGSLPITEGGWRTKGPSAISYPGLAKPEILSRSQIQGIVEAFTRSAARAVEAGFDMVELHAAHGYLIHEFLSPLSNERHDEYGGSLRNRSRFLLEIVDAVRACIGGDVPLLVRLSATDWIPGGIDIEETTQLVMWLAEHGVDLVDISTGANVPANISVGPGYQVPFATSIKQATGMPVAAVGMIDGALQAEQIVATGLADVVMIGREFLRDANFALNAARFLAVDIPYHPRPYLRAYR